MDDLDIGSEVMAALGVSQEETTSTEEKVGEERLGSPNAASTFGPTLLLGSIALIVLVLILILAMIVLKRMLISEEGRERIKKLKRMVFFNPIIRYLVLNSLKLNMAGLVPFKMASGASASEIMTAMSIVLVVNGAPILFYLALRRHHLALQEDDNKASFGALYKGKNVHDKNHRVWFYVLLFFWRRTLFVAASVFLFDYPLMQMMAHYLLTGATIVLLTSNRRLFESAS